MEFVKYEMLYASFVRLQNFTTQVKSFLMNEKKLRVEQHVKLYRRQK